MPHDVKRPVASSQDWNARLAAVDLTKDDLNAIIANYLFTEGFLDAAENFSREANLEPGIDLENIQIRMEIRRTIHAGEIQTATRLVNELDPELFETNPQLHFHLLQLHFIELIRQQKVADALEFAQTELAPRGEERPEFLKELERTMSLLAFELPNFPSESSPTAPMTAPSKAGKSSKKDTNSIVPMPESISSLLDPSHRFKTAKELNSAILTAQSHSQEPKLPGLMKMLIWGEQLLTEKGADFPKWSFEKLARLETEKTKTSDMEIN